jgi:putative FmdB family regulatory protein
MPIFEYLCDDCGTKFEKLVRRDERVLCPECGEDHLTTQHSTFSAHASGSPKESAMPSCPGGMCRAPDICGRN